MSLILLFFRSFLTFFCYVIFYLFWTLLIISLFVCWRDNERCNKNPFFFINHCILSHYSNVEDIESLPLGLKLSQEEMRWWHGNIVILLNCLVTKHSLVLTVRHYVVQNILLKVIYSVSKFYLEEEVNINILLLDSLISDMLTIK